MKIFRRSQYDLLPVESIPGFKRERELQRLVEDNVDVIFGLELVKSEFSLEECRMDTLCFDRNTNSFVILEYKRSESGSVVDQGVHYLEVLRKRHADAILEYNEKNTPSTLKRDDVNWKQSRVIFISPRFTRVQIGAARQDSRFELWEVRCYSHDILVLYQPTGDSRTPELISPPPPIRVQGQPSVPPRYTEAYHIEKANRQVAQVYKALRDRLLEWHAVDLYATKAYLGFKREGRIFVTVYMQRNSYWVFINSKKGQIDDPWGVLEDASSGRQLGDYRIQILPGGDLDHVISLIRQSYEEKR